MNLFKDLLVKAFDTEKRALHPLLYPPIEVAQEEVDTGLHEPLHPVPRQQFDHLFGVLRNIPEILVEDEHVLDLVRDVKLDRFFDGLQRNRLWAGRESGGLAERARETAPARREQNSDGHRPASRKPELRYQWGMPNCAERLAEILRYRVFAVSVEDVIETGLQRGSQRSVIAGPKPLHTRRVRFLSHLQNVVALLKVEGEAHNVPALFQSVPIFGARRVLEDFYFRNILTEEPQTKRNAARHLKPPAESFGSVLPIIIIEAEITIDRGHQNASHGQRLREEGFGRDAPGVLFGSPTLACSQRPTNTVGRSGGEIVQ